MTNLKLRNELNRFLRTAIFGLVLIGATMLLIIWSAQYLPTFSKLDGITPVTTPNSFENYIKVSSRLWDTNYYRDNAKYGYSAKYSNNFAFFPLFSGEIRLINYLISNLDWAVLVTAYINLTLLIYCLDLFYEKLSLKYPNLVTNNQNLKILSLFLPFTFYFFFPYTEALFAWILISIFILLEFEEDWRLLTLPIFTAGLSLTRSSGVFTVIILLCYLLFELFKRKRSWIKIAIIPVAMFTAIAGLYGFMLFGEKTTGNFWVSSSVQSNWGRKNTSDITAEFKRTARCLIQREVEPVCEKITYRKLGYEIYPWIALIIFCVSSVFSLWVFWRQKNLVLASLFYSLAVIILPLTTTSLDSFYRYMMLTPVYFLLLPIILQKYLKPQAITILIAILAMIQSIFIILFGNGYWVV